MIWAIIIVAALLAVCSWAAFKYGEVHELHKTRAAFKNYLDAHSSVRESLKPGFDKAEEILDELEGKKEE